MHGGMQELHGGACAHPYEILQGSGRGIFHIQKESGTFGTATQKNLFHIL